MTNKPSTDTTITQDGNNDASIPPSGMHGPHHNALDMAEIAAHDELQHEDALRHSSLRVPR